MTAEERKEELVELHFITCDCERCNPPLCVHCGQPEKAHYRVETGKYCIGFYDSTKVFTPAVGGERA